MSPEDDLRLDVRAVLETEDGDVDALAAAICSLLADNELRSTMDAAGAKRARKTFCGDGYVGQWLDKYRATALNEDSWWGEVVENDASEKLLTPIA